MMHVIIICIITLSLFYIKLTIVTKPSLTPEERAKELVAKMSIKEKVSLMYGISSDYVGEVTTPEDRANLNFGYRMDDWSFSWRMRYWGKSVDSVEEANFNFSTFEPLTDFNNFDAVVYHDISATYYISDNAETTIGIRNLFDEEPQFAGQGFDKGGTGINTVSEAYDVTGQYLNASITVRF